MSEDQHLLGQEGMNQPPWLDLKTHVDLRCLINITCSVSLSYSIVVYPIVCNIACTFGLLRLIIFPKSFLSTNRSQAQVLRETLGKHGMF